MHKYAVNIVSSAIPFILNSHLGNIFRVFSFTVHLFGLTEKWDIYNLFEQLYNALAIFDSQIYSVKRNANTNLFVIENKIVVILRIFILFSFSRVGFGQVPPLGTTSTFALFTAVGAFNSVGTTTVTGDIGTDVGAFTGFPPGTLVGTSHVADAVSAQAAIDVNAAYSFLAGVTCGSVVGTTLGNNQALTPNVYCLGAASTLTGNLILDGLGNPNSVFIFKINGALTTSAFSNIVLTNSTDLNNVYWQINGLFSLGDNSVFRGTIICNGAINLLLSSSLEGRGLSRAGAISLSNNSVSLIYNAVALPIELIRFGAECKNQKTQLKWSTASEIKSDYCLIESSVDGSTWKTVGKVMEAGNSAVQRNYSYTDEESHNSIFYYRLKQIDLDKNVTYSKIIYSKNCTENLIELDIYPNPGNGRFNFLFKGDKRQFISISIYNSIAERVYNSENFQSTIDLSDKNSGMYFLYFNFSSGLITKKLAIK